MQTAAPNEQQQPQPLAQSSLFSPASPPGQAFPESRPDEEGELLEEPERPGTTQGESTQPDPGA
ncbi:hypothetical protein chiPu_0031028, partial [Chiloscyllium punctatum]|nr:hypothetical protein [Chiloscyllium punctatum]